MKGTCEISSEVYDEPKLDGDVLKKLYALAAATHQDAEAINENMKTTSSQLSSTENTPHAQIHTC